MGESAARSTVQGSRSAGVSSSATGDTPPIYREVQRFRQWIFWLPILAIVGVVWWQFVEQVILGHPQGEQPLPNWLAWVLTLIFGVGLPASIWVVRLITEVRLGELTVRVAPFKGTTIPVDRIRDAAVRRYSALREYGGWGVRMNRWNGRAYNAYGEWGVQLMMAEEELVLIGSQHAEELLAALKLAGVDLGRPDTASDRSRAPSAETEPDTERSDS